MKQTKRMLRRYSIALCALVLSIMGVSAHSQTASSRAEQPRLLTATGTAEIRVRPDLGVVTLGVVTEAPTAAQARQENATRAQRVVGALRDLGLAENDISTSTFQISPVRRGTDQQQGEPPIVGYSVTNIVTARTANLDLIPRIIDQAVAAGANRVDNVGFTLKESAAPRQRVLRQAIADARANAQQMASELGIRLVRVYNVQQGGVGPIQPMYRAESLMAAGAATPILPGEITLDASATVTYVIQ